MATGFSKFWNGITIKAKATLTNSGLGDLETSSSTNKTYLHNGSTSSPLVTEAQTATLTNKSIDSSTNTITNIANASISAGAAIAVSKLGNGDVSNTQLSYLNTTTSNVQTQINNVVATANAAISSLTGDVTASGPGAAASTIAANAVTNAKLAQMASHTFKGNNTGSTANASDLTATQLTAELNNFVGDSGSGGTKGLTPAPAAGDAAASKFLKADGTWATVTSGFANPMTTLGDTIYGGAAGAATRLAGNTTNTREFLTSQGSGGLATAPTLSALVSGDIPNNAANTTGTASNVTGVVALVNGGTGTAAASANAAYNALSPMTTTGDIEYESATGIASRLPIGSANQVLTVVSGKPAWNTAPSGGGVNFLNLDTTWLPNLPDNVNWEGTASLWAAYANTAGVSPTTGTGGSPVVTVTRTTSATQIQDGQASGLITKDGANRQGQGASLLFNVPPAYQGVQCSINIPYRILSGSLVSGDLNAFIIDVTNSNNLTTPANNSIIGSSGILQASFITTQAASTSSANLQMRLCLHFASTSATAVTIAFDDAQISPIQVSAGPVINPWQAYTPTFTGFGTVSTQNFRYRQVGDSYEIAGTFTLGTTTATEARVSLPNGATTTSGNPTLSQIGTFSRGGASVTQHGGPIFLESSVTYVTFNDSTAWSSTSSNTLTKSNGNNFNSGEILSLNATVPISGLAASASITQASTFSIANIASTGTRVTAAPANLGEYRSRYKSAITSNTLTDVAPTTGPTSGDGFKLDSANYASAQTSGLISFYDIFIGKNVNYRIDYFSSTGRTGAISTDYYVDTTTLTNGVRTSYDAAAGVLTIEAGVNDTTNTTRNVGITPTTGSGLATGYFDVNISQTAVPIQLSTKAYIQYTGNGGTSITANTTNIDWTTKVVDSNGLWTSNTTYTANKTGMVSLEGSVFLTGAATPNFFIYINGTKKFNLNTSVNTSTQSISGAAFLNTGDTLTVRSDTSVTLSNNAQIHWISIMSQE